MDKIGVTAKTVQMRSADRSFEAFVASPPTANRTPGVLVLHEIFGLTPWVQDVARRLAAAGFLALAPDLFSGRLHPQFASEVAERMMPLVWQMPVDVRIQRKLFEGALKGHRAADVEIAWALSQLGQDLAWLPPATADLKVALEHLRGDPRCTGTVGAVGFCLGGKLAFHLATVEPRLGAAVVFYGAGPREEEIARIACPVLGLYGEDDEYITKDVPRVAAAMRRFGKTFEFEVYNRTGHAFARVGSKHYREDRAQDAWARTETFLTRVLEARAGTPTS